MNRNVTDFKSTIGEIWGIREKELLSRIRWVGRIPNGLDSRRRNLLVRRAMQLAYDALRPNAKKEFRRMILESTRRTRRPNLRKTGRMNWSKVVEYIKSKKKLDKSEPKCTSSGEGTIASMSARAAEVVWEVVASGGQETGGGVRDIRCSPLHTARISTDSSAWQLTRSARSTTRTSRPKGVTIQSVQFMHH